MLMTFTDIEGFDLEYFTGTISMASRVTYRGRVLPAQNRITYILRFFSGVAYFVHGGRLVRVGEMQLGRLIISRFGVRNEGLRFILFPNLLLDSPDPHEEYQFTPDSLMQYPTFGGWCNLDKTPMSQQEVYPELMKTIYEVIESSDVTARDVLTAAD